MNRPLKIRTYIFFTKITSGILWIAMGVLNNAEFSKPVAIAVATICGMLIIPQLMATFRKKEPFDEFAREHERIAKSICVEASILLFMAFSLLANISFIRERIPLQAGLDFMVGTLFLLYGIPFFIMEQKSSMNEETTKEEE